MQTTLTKPEWIILSALWDQPEQPVSGVIHLLQDQLDWKYNTYVTYLKRMCEKGLVAYHQLGRDKFYYPAVEKSACILAESQSVLEKIDQHATKEFLVHMIKGSSLSGEDVHELRELLRTLNGEDA